MEPATYLEHLRADGEALAAAARTAPTAPIPTCPEWDMTGLLDHTGGVHRWVDHLVATKAAAYVRRQSPAHDSFPAALDSYEEGLAQLLATLGGTDPDQAVWNWLDQGPAPARFWFRRMANETAVHRWDGEAGAGCAGAIEADLAVDGIDEFLSFVARWLAREPVAGLAGSLHLHATDTDGEWSLVLSPDRLEHRREHSKAGAAVRGPVSDLFLWMLNRVPASSPNLQVFGDQAIVERWRLLR
ncbi:MAG: maleylpyruvate isomerase family mycothiol-dependent enzyme, partial [Actinomycetota bacterium]|nr:maleylpyruvate isomerase family mycothiol-dependent enzyme [Actinomycetota bacterium]